MDSIKKVSLPQVLNILENPVSSNPTIFVDSSGSLETFFTYKGKVIELQKIDLSLKMSKIKLTEASEQLRTEIISALRFGNWLVFCVGASPSFNFAEFFKQFSFNKGDSKFFNNNHILNKSYLKSSGILNENDDKDVYGNHGFWEIDENSRIVYLTNCTEEDIPKIKSSNSGLNFDYYLIE